MRVDDVEGNVCKALARGGPRAVRAGGAWHIVLATSYDGISPQPMHERCPHAAYAFYTRACLPTPIRNLVTHSTTASGLKSRWALGDVAGTIYVALRAGPQPGARRAAGAARAEHGHPREPEPVLGAVRGPERRVLGGRAWQALIAHCIAFHSTSQNEGSKCVG